MEFFSHIHGEVLSVQCTSTLHRSPLGPFQHPIYINPQLSLGKRRHVSRGENPVDGSVTRQAVKMRGTYGVQVFFVFGSAEIGIDSER